MSNIPSSKRYIQLEGTLDRKPISQDLLQAMGGSINYILDSVDAFGFKYQEFNANGLWTAPASTTSIMLLGCGGGGGGAASSGGFGLYNGGYGALTQLKIVPVTGSTTYTILIGSGGAGGFSNTVFVPASGNRGGSTFFNDGATTLCEFKGGRGGIKLFDGSFYTASALPNILPFDSANYLAGDNDTGIGNIISGGGGAGPFGNGTNGVARDVGSVTTSSAAANSGAGGGAARCQGSLAAQGGAGGSGKLFVIWF